MWSYQVSWYNYGSLWRNFFILSKYLDPINDIAFKTIFGTEKNKDILIHFLNDILVFKNDTRSDHCLWKNQVLWISYAKINKEAAVLWKCKLLPFLQGFCMAQRKLTLANCNGDSLTKSYAQCMGWGWSMRCLINLRNGIIIIKWLMIKTILN